MKSKIAAFLVLSVALILLAGCAAPTPAAATPNPAPTDAPTATLEPTAAATATLEPTAAPTEAPAATQAAPAAGSGSGVAPKPGMWEGDNNYFFEVTSDGHIKGFRMAVMFGSQFCTITAEDFVIEDGAFFHSEGGQMSVSDLDFIARIGQIPTPIVTETVDDMASIEALRITGTFDTPETLTGTYIARMCGNQWNIQLEEEKTFTAHWKE